MVNSNEKDKSAEDLANSEEPQFEELSGDQLDDVQGGAGYVKMEGVWGETEPSAKGGNVEYYWEVEEGGKK